MSVQVASVAVVVGLFRSGRWMVYLFLVRVLIRVVGVDYAHEPLVVAVALASLRYLVYRLVHAALSCEL